MKKLVLLLFILILSLSFVNADCDDNQTILRLSSSNNAHGAIWSNTIYPVQICYDEIFSQAYSGDTPHSCSGNKILKLNNEINAHAEVASLDNYNIEVCYGDLSCEAKGENCDEASGEKLIVSLSSTTNAHLSSSNNYPIKICCRKGMALDQAYWANMNDEAIDKADLKDFVKLVVSGAGLQEINYTIYRQVDFWFDRKIAVGSRGGELIWQAGKKSDGSFSQGTYYFIARLESRESLTSDNLKVTEENNFEPVARIISPKDKQVYFLNEVLNFSIQTSDKDDVLYYSFDLGDGTTRTGNSLTKENSSFEYSYSSSGQKNIILKVSNSRGQEAIDRISILIINSSYLLAYIDEPKFGLTYRRIVNFNASSSYAVNSVVNNGIRQISCLMGSCPNQTEGCPPPQTGCHISIADTPKDYDNANFTWIFDDIPSNNKTGQGLINFTKNFREAGRHKVSLIISMNPSSSVSTEFDIFFDTIECSSGEDYSRWYFPSGNIRDSFDNCYLEEIDESCCPNSHSCNQETNKCALDYKTACSDYITEEECAGDLSNVAELDVKQKTGKEDFCNSDNVIERLENCEKYVTGCRCFWNETARRCDARWSLNTQCGEEEPILDGDCIYTSTQETNCSLGYMHIEWLAEWDGLPNYKPEECESGQEQVQCLSETLLGFIDGFGLILAIILMVIAYWIIVHNKKHHARKRK